LRRPAARAAAPASRMLHSFRLSGERPDPTVPDIR
jgi:hypothetical protein